MKRIISALLAVLMLAALLTVGASAEEDLLQKANSHVEQVLDNIKEYLGLDMVTTDCHILDKLCLLTQEHQQPAEG